MEAGAGSLIPKRHSLDRTGSALYIVPPPPRKWWMYWQGQELTKQMGKLSDLSAGISMVAPLSLGLSEKKVAMGLRNRGLFCKATSVRFFISSEIEVDVPAD